MSRRKNRNDCEWVPRIPDVSSVSNGARGDLYIFDPTPNRPCWVYVVYVKAARRAPQQSIRALFPDAFRVCRRAGVWIDEHASKHQQPWVYWIRAGELK